MLSATAGQPIDRAFDLPVINQAQKISFQWPSIDPENRMLDNRSKQQVINDLFACVTKDFGKILSLSKEGSIGALEVTKLQESVAGLIIKNPKSNGEPHSQLVAAAKCHEGFKALIADFDNFRVKCLGDSELEIAQDFAVLVEKFRSGEAKLQQIKEDSGVEVASGQKFVKESKIHADQFNQHNSLAHLLPLVSLETEKLIQKDLTKHAEFTQRLEDKTINLKCEWNAASLGYRHTAALLTSFSNVMDVLPEVVSIHRQIEELLKEAQSSKAISAETYANFTSLQDRYKQIQSAVQAKVSGSGELPAEVQAERDKAASYIIDGIKDGTAAPAFAKIDEQELAIYSVVLSSLHQKWNATTSNMLEFNSLYHQYLLTTDVQNPSAEIKLELDALIKLLDGAIATRDRGTFSENSLSAEAALKAFSERMEAVRKRSAEVKAALPKLETFEKTALVYFTKVGLYQASQAKPAVEAIYKSQVLSLQKAEREIIALTVTADQGMQQAYNEADKRLKEIKSVLAKYPEKDYPNDLTPAYTSYFSSGVSLLSGLLAKKPAPAAAAAADVLPSASEAEMNLALLDELAGDDTDSDDGLDSANAVKSDSLLSLKEELQLAVSTS